MHEILSLNNVTFTYAPDEPAVKNAVEDVSFKVEEGEWIAIVGHNGSGKSTIARNVLEVVGPENVSYIQQDS